MKKLIILCLLIFAGSTFAQYPGLWKIKSDTVRVSDTTWTVWLPQYAKLSLNNLFTGSNSFKGASYFGKASNTQGDIRLYNEDNAFYSQIVPTTPASNILFTLPATGGTFAMLTDIPSLAGYGALAGANIWTANNTFQTGILTLGSASHDAEVKFYNESNGHVTNLYTNIPASDGITVLLPASAGTLALQSDITSIIDTTHFVRMTGNQTVSGNKTFNDQLQAYGTFILPQSIAPTVEGQIYYSQAGNNAIIYMTGSGIDTLADQAYVRTHGSGGGGAGITSINSQTGATQTLVVGSTGTDFAISSSGGIHTFNIPSASATNRGLVTTGSQTFAGNKTFNGVTQAYGGFILPQSITPTVEAQIYYDQASSNKIIFMTGGGIDTLADQAYARSVAGGGGTTYNIKEDTTHKSIGVGKYSIRGLTSGNYNTALGYHSLYHDATAASNTAIGYNALFASSSGANNTAVGSLALSANTSAGENTAIGEEALAANTTGAQNTAIGSLALGANTAGAYNVAIGRYAGLYYTGGFGNTNGSGNVYIGVGSSASADYMAYEIAIGYNSVGHGSLTTTLGTEGFTTATVLPSSSYLNFGTTAGSGGFGFRSNSGVMEYKSGSTWKSFTVYDQIVTQAVTADVTIAVGGKTALVLTPDTNGWSVTFSGMVAGQTMFVTNASNANNMIITGGYTMNQGTSRYFWYSGSSWLATN